MANTDIPQEATKRLQAKKQTLDDAYAAPANFLEIDVVRPETHGLARTRYTDYEVRMRVSTSGKRKRMRKRMWKHLLFCIASECAN